MGFDPAARTGPGLIAVPFRTPWQPVVWQFHVLETQSFHGQLPGVYPLQLGRRGSSLGQQRRAAQSEEKLSAVHTGTSLPKVRARDATGVDNQASFARND